jgi:predicted nucleic acid-binding protein
MPYVTDTHPLVWHFTRNKRLSTRVAGIFNAADLGQEIIYIPAIVLGELIHISETGQVPLNFSATLIKIKSGDNFVTVPLDLSIIEAANEIRPRLEMHDRLVIATAQILSLPLITFDEAMTSARVVSVVW